MFVARQKGTEAKQHRPLNGSRRKSNSTETCHDLTFDKHDDAIPKPEADLGHVRQLRRKSHDVSLKLE
jgi:hypothetical protein